MTFRVGGVSKTRMNRHTMNLFANLQGCLSITRQKPLAMMEVFPAMWWKRWNEPWRQNIAENLALELMKDRRDWHESIRMEIVRCDLSGNRYKKALVLGWKEVFVALKDVKGMRQRLVSFAGLKPLWHHKNEGKHPRNLGFVYFFDISLPTRA